MSEDELLLKANQWELSHGGLSGRTAQQFIDYLLGPVSYTHLDVYKRQLPGRWVFAIGNAPTALIRLHELILEKKVDPVLVIGVPVGFVNVVESKEEILKDPVPVSYTHLDVYKRQLQWRHFWR